MKALKTSSKPSLQTTEFTAIPLLTLDKEELLKFENANQDKIIKKHESETKEKLESLEDHISSLKEGLARRTFVYYDAIWGNLSRKEQLGSLGGSEF